MKVKRAQYYFLTNRAIILIAARAFVNCFVGAVSSFLKRFMSYIILNCVSNQVELLFLQYKSTRFFLQGCISHVCRIYTKKMDPSS